jgi:hypothetical protein
MVVAVEVGAPAAVELVVTELLNDGETVELLGLVVAALVRVCVADDVREAVVVVVEAGRVRVVVGVELTVAATVVVGVDVSVALAVVVGVDVGVDSWHV